MNKKIFNKVFAVCAVFAFTTAYGGDTTSSKSVYLSGYTYNLATYEYLSVFGSSDQRFPDNSYVSVNGFSNEQFFYCYGYGSAFVNAIDVSTTVSKGSIQVDSTQLTCYQGTPPQTITMNCSEDEQYSDSYVANGSSTYNGVSYKYHSNSKSNSAKCTLTTDQVNIDYGQSGGWMSRTQYVQKSN
ncbi:hypothetical protein SAMN05421755_105714 [Nitrosomonas sp. Nm33]|nr:hypothetical protein SAMN05421755_105714 [Nitrosomonas sp. Nm33]